MGQNARAAIGFGVEVQGEVYGNALVRDARDSLAQRMGLGSASYLERSESEEALYQEFKKEWAKIGITSICGGSLDSSDVVLVADETKRCTWWDSPGKMGELPSPTANTFQDRLDQFLSLVEDPLEINDKPQWYIVAFFG